jgi:hypothetical protein
LSPLTPKTTRQSLTSDLYFPAKYGLIRPTFDYVGLKAA